MTREETNQHYFQWMYDLACGKRFRRGSYKKILNLLNETNFYYILPRDANRFEDGISLRYRFGYINDIPDYIIAEFLDDRPCSVLEMMIALCVRCEESITNNPEIGDRTSFRFWKMMQSLGLYSMSDSRFHKRTAQSVIERFLNRQYEKNGKGGLFTLNSCGKDLRIIEIWYQMMFYLDETEL